MVDRIGPVNAVTGAPAFDGRWERQLRGVHQAMGATARPLGARTGVRPGTPTTTVTATATTWTAQAFAGCADVESAAEAGAYPFSFDAVATGAMTPADGTNPRVDIVYVQIDDPAEDGSSAPAATRKYLAGVPAASPVPPTLPVSRAFVIAEINVPKSGAGSPSVTWVAPYTAAAGGAVPFPKLAALRLWKTAAALQLASVFDDGANNGLYAWMGASWVPLSPALAVVTPSSVSGGTVSDTGTITYAAVGAVQVNGVFTSQFDNYLITIDNTAKTAAANIALQMCSGGAVDSSAANYAAVRGYDTGGSRQVGTMEGTLAAIEVEAACRASRTSR